MQTIARHIKNSRVCALARALPKDIDAAGEALRVAEAFRIHTFISTSSIHVESKLKKSFEDVLEMGSAPSSTPCATPMMWSSPARMRAARRR